MVSRRPQAQGPASPNTSTFVTGRTTGPPSGAFGEANVHQTAITTSAITIASSTPPAWLPHTAAAAAANSSSTNTSANTNQPNATMRPASHAGEVCRVVTTRHTRQCGAQSR